MKAVIIAGGLGTRLRPLTCNTPKPIVLVANRPFIVHQIEHLVKHGVDEIIVNLHYLSHEIKKILGDGRAWGIKIHYSIEESPLGTAGAVKNAEEYFGDGPLVVFNGDVLTDANISKIINFHREKKAVVTLTLTEVEDPTPFGLVLTDANGRVTEFIEKPSWERVTAKTINAGVYILDPKIFRAAPRNQPYSFERELYPDLLARGALIYGYRSEAYWIDIGNPQKYQEAHQAILHGEVAVKIIGARIDGKFWLGKETTPDATVKFIGASIVGEKVKFGRQVEVRDGTVIADQVSIGDYSILERAIIWPHSHIGKNVKLVDCIVGAHCQIEDDVVIKAGIAVADNSAIKKGSLLAA
ncbi:NDP-sugar synthase [Candidatus Saganbacteria bacterium]|nr:NDP-sugar synthase [Candidatus Saganbacteria bacterium]